MDEVVTCEDVSRWLPLDVRRSIEAGLAPPLRGWLTRSEVERYRGSTVEALSLSSTEVRYYPTGLRWRETWADDYITG